MNVVLFCGCTDEKARVSAVVNTALLAARPDRKVVITTVSRNSFGLDWLVWQEDEPMVLDYRSRIGLIVLSAAGAEQDGDTGNADEHLDYGTLRVKKPSKCLIPRPLKSEDATLLLLRGGPRRFSESSYGQEEILDWNDLWSNWAGAAFFEHVVDDLSRTANLLIVDCDLATNRDTALLLSERADVMVLLTDYSEGATAEAYHFASELSSKFPEREKPAILAIPCPVHINEEIEILEKSRNHFEEYLSSKYSPERLEPFWFVEAGIPYVPYYTYRSIVLVEQDISRLHVPLYRAYAYVANKIVECAEAATATEEDTQKGLSERFLDARKRVRWDVFISHSSTDVSAASALREILRASQLRAFLSGDDLTFEIGTKKWLEAINQVLERSTVLVILVSEAALESKWVRHEFDEFAKHRRLVVPVALGSANIPDFMAEYQAPRWDGRVESQDELRRIISLVFGGLGN
jgi:TIR domain